MLSVMSSRFLPHSHCCAHCVFGNTPRGRHNDVDELFSNKPKITFCIVSLYIYQTGVTGASWHFRSPASRLFVGGSFRITAKEISKVHTIFHLCGEYTGHRWIPLMKEKQYRKRKFHVKTLSWGWAYIDEFQSVYGPPQAWHWPFSTGIVQGPILFTWINFNPCMDM